MKQVHMPPNFGRVNKPHVVKIDGVWWATWPAGMTYGPPPNEVEVWQAWLRKVNGITLEKPTSWVWPPHERMQ